MVTKIKAKSEVLYVTGVTLFPCVLIRLKLPYTVYIQSLLWNHTVKTQNSDSITTKPAALITDLLLSPPLSVREQPNKIQ